MKPALTALLAFGLLGGCSKSIEDKDVVGTYERREGDATYTLIFHGNGVVKEYCKTTGSSSSAVTYILEPSGLKVIPLK